MALYELALMGAPSTRQIDELAQYLAQIVDQFGLQLGREVGWSVCPTHFSPSPRTSAAIAFFGEADISGNEVNSALRNGIPVLPIVSASGRFGLDIPEQLRAFNGLTYEVDGPERISTALLECLGLLPRQRRVFVSYRLSEARAAALQLFDALSARLFDVFLDTHGVPPAEDFQAVLWHRLCDSDVLVMLDTENYFESRWTSAEFGRALAKGISVLRVGWPDVSPSPRTSTASLVNLTVDEIDVGTGFLADDPINRICIQIEAVRSQSQAVRGLNLYSMLQQAVQKIGGNVSGVGLHNAIYIRLPGDINIIVYPKVGVPTSLTLHEAIEYAEDRPVAVVYDHIGLDSKWLKHLDWLGQTIPGARWIKVSEAAWSLAGWEV